MKKNTIDVLLVKYPFATKDFFLSNYVENQLSLPDFKRRYSMPYSTTQRFLSLYEIPIRSIKESTGLQKTIKKRQDTTLERFGVENASQAQEIKEKKALTFVAHYGVDNVFKTENFIQDVAIPARLKKYGTLNNNKNGGLTTYWRSSAGQACIAEKSKKQAEALKAQWAEKSQEEKKAWSDQRKAYWEALSDEEKNRRIHEILTSARSRGQVSNKLETKVHDALKSVNVPFSIQFVIGRKAFDILLGETLIEVNGDYWHANPLVYNDSDIINYPGKKGVSVKEIWKKDEMKRQVAQDNGYALIVLWESELNSCESNDQVLELLQEKMNHLEITKPEDAQ